MIDYIKYTVDGSTYSLINNGDGTWSKESNAPEVSGNYSLLFEISENGIITFIDGSDSRYDTYLQVIESTERKVFLIKCLPDFLQDITEFQNLFATEDLALDNLYSDVEKVKNNMFITTASIDAIKRLETFLRIKGQGTLEQRKSYLKSLFQSGNKLTEAKIIKLAKTITGSGCIIALFGSDELNNPEPGYCLLRVQVLSPDNTKDYRYEDIARSLKPLVPGHIKLLVVKYFSTWKDIITNYADWSAMYATANWQTIRDYIPPQ